MMLKGRVTDKRAIALGVRVQVWYLVNLLLLPGIGFGVVAWKFVRYQRDAEHPFALAFAKGAFYASLLGGGLIFLGCGLMWWFAASASNALAMIVLYFTVMHSTFILWGILNIARAMAGKPIAPLGFDV